MKRVLLGLLVLVLVVAGVGYAFRTTIALRLMERVVTSRLQSTLLDELPDGLHVALCGAGSPMPDPQRSGPCTAVIAGKRLYIVDVGAGSPRVLNQMRVPQGEIDAVLLTHFHSDHIDGLGELELMRWANGARTSPVPVHGPEGVERVVAGFNDAYALEQSYRVAHHGEEIVPPSGAGGIAVPFATPAEGAGQVVIDEAGLKVTAFRVSHQPVDPAVGYRFDYRGRSLVISGDTTKSATVERFARDVDLLVHEALAPHLVEVITLGARNAGRDNLATITTDILDYHTSPVEAAEVARDAGVRALVYNHIVPPLPLAALEEVFLEGVDEVYDGPIYLGRDGILIRLPAGSQAIEVDELL
jgi:ribonuclease Z